jgi:hypothetical protein
VISGHRRRAAFLMLAEKAPHDPRWRSIPAVVRTMDDEVAYLALLSAQLHNRNWQPKEESAALERLAETRTLAQVGLLVHKGESWVSKRLRLYADAILSPLVQTGRLSLGAATELLLVKDAVQRKEMADRAVAEEWGQEQARAAVRKLKAEKVIRELDRQVMALLDVLSSIEASRIPIESFRSLQVLRGRIEVISEVARGGQPKFPTIEQAAKVAGVNLDRPIPPKRKRRTMPRPA